MVEDAYTLVIGSKEGSSWSLRPWLLMKQAGIPFTEILITLRQPDTRAEIAKYSPSGAVPVLRHGERAIWDSLAIAEYLAERHPEKALWPGDDGARAFARSISAEMHSSFRALRYGLPMEFSKRNLDPAIDAEVEADISRVVAIWCEARQRFGEGGPFLFGRFSIADAMYAPVASRFTTFDSALKHHGDDGAADAWRSLMMALRHMVAWGDAAKSENMPRWKP